MQAVPGQAGPVQIEPVQAAPGETMAAAMQLAIALLTAGLDSPELEAWAADSLTPIDADGLGDFMAGLHVISVVLLNELHEATGEPSAAILQRLAILAERRRGNAVRRLGQCRRPARSSRTAAASIQPPAVNSRYLLSVLVDEPTQGCRSNLTRLDRTMATMTEPGAATPAKELVSLTDTADLYATVTGLIERSAAAYASGVPEGTGDDGFFGPASVTWRMSADLASPVAGLRSLLMQALHPLAMAGVDQHSGWRRDPVGRLAATMAYLATVTFGDRAAAMQAAARVRRIHDHVRGTDAVTGRPYAAGDPALLLWVHGALVDSVLAAGSQMGTALSAADSNRYVAEMVTAAELTGVPRLLVPSNVPELDLYIASVRPTLHCTPAAAESMAYLLEPPGMDEDTAAIWQDVRDAAIAVLPRWARQMYGYDSPPPLTPDRRTEIRQSLGVLDAMFLGQPGVLEARQQITRRMRAARPA